MINNYNILMVLSGVLASAFGGASPAAGQALADGVAAAVPCLLRESVDAAEINPTVHRPVLIVRNTGTGQGPVARTEVNAQACAVFDTTRMPSGTPADTFGYFINWNLGWFNPDGSLGNAAGTIAAVPAPRPAGIATAALTPSWYLADKQDRPWPTMLLAQVFTRQCTNADWSAPSRCGNQPIPGSNIAWSTVLLHMGAPAAGISAGANTCLGPRPVAAGKGRGAAPDVVLRDIKVVGFGNTFRVLSCLAGFTSKSFATAGMDVILLKRGPGGALVPASAQAGNTRTGIGPLQWGEAGMPQVVTLLGTDVTALDNPGAEIVGATVRVHYIACRDGQATQCAPIVHTAPKFYPVRFERGG